MGYGVNREFAVCSTCGHPLMAHLNGGCYCGCRGSATGRGQPHPTTASRPTPSKSKSRGRASVPSKRPVDEFVEFIRVTMSHAQASQLLMLLAAAKNATLKPNAAPLEALHQLASDYLTPNELTRYLTELRRRRDEHEPLVRTRRLREAGMTPAQSETP